MDEKATVLVVDDDPFMEDLFKDILESDYRLLAADNGADALMLAQAEQPDLIILDVEMPGMDGYEVCSRLKQEDATAAIPVIFVSGHDKLEERLKGYDVGGNDYVIKPFEPRELLAKITYLLGLTTERAQLKETASFAGKTAMMVMTSMSELGALLEVLKKFNASADDLVLAGVVLEGLALYGLSGVVQVCTPERTLSLNMHGEASPLELSVISHMSGMDRIVHFKTRMSIHYPHVTLLVNDMPIEDPDRCGRLRDHLAMLVEGAEMRAAGIVAENESKRRGITIEKMVESVSSALKKIDASQRQYRMETRAKFSSLTDEFEKALLHVAITREQEEYLSSIITNGMEEILNVQSAEADIQDKLSSIVTELKSISDTGVAPPSETQGR